MAAPGHTFSLDEFAAATAPTAAEPGTAGFALEGDRLLAIDLDGQVWTKSGSMVAYNGDIKFTREGILEHGLGKFLKKALTGEGSRLTKAEGHGRLFLAELGKKVTILQLDGDSISVNGNDVLAFESSVEWDIKLMRKVAGMLGGGIFNMRLSGSGAVAIMTHYDPLTLRVTPDAPISTDPNATVAWTTNLEPKLQVDVSLKSFFGRGSGESLQMRFEGDGFVVIQPYEETYAAGQ
jgi:uncharacterized protein (AIM24 family)